MCEETKRIVDVLLTVIAMVGAVIAFAKAIHEWQVSQKWKRAEHLDGLIDNFESQPLLRMGTLLLDWTFRRFTLDGKIVIVTNCDVLLALRRHVEDHVTEFDGNKALVRDCLDAMLGFFSRVETALATGLIDEGPTRQHFQYWVKKLVRMDSHPVMSNDPHFQIIDEALKRRSPSEMVAAYVAAYGDTKSFRRLCVKLAIPFPELDRLAES